MSALVLAHTRAWVERAVIGLNLCPFAKAPQVKGLVRYVVSAAAEPRELLQSLAGELQRLAGSAAAQIETTLLIHPNVLTDFADYNDFLTPAEDLVADLELEGVIQIAGFHPHYQFAGSAPENPGNATNRSPYPLLHLIREASIERAVAAFPDPRSIYAANIATLERLGADGWAELQQNCRSDAGIDR